MSPAPDYGLLISVLIAALTGAVGVCGWILSGLRSEIKELRIGMAIGVKELHQRIDETVNTRDCERWQANCASLMARRNVGLGPK